MRPQTWTVLAAPLLATVLACAGVRQAPGAVPPHRAIPLVLVKGGCFPMGSAQGTPGGPEEKPAHEVCVDEFSIGKYEVTQAQWASLMGSQPSLHQDCADCPVENVSWHDAQEFIRRLNADREARAGGPPFRLPTEAEWEYAARSGGRAETYSGEVTDVGRIGWFNGNATSTQPVGTKAPNGLGIHDMSGNVWEWTGDWYDPRYYEASPRANPTGPAAGERRVLRGGSFSDETFDLRTSYRNFLPPDYRSRAKGFRLARSATSGR